MLFNSYSFVFLFLPITIIGYYFLNAKQKYKLSEVFLFAMSVIFYGLFDVSCLLIIAVSICINYALSQLMIRKSSKWILITGIAFDVLLLCYFKYTNFVLNNLGKLFQTEFSLLDIIVPVGISFMTFQQISYLVDVYRNKEIKYCFREYALYAIFFPYVISGPIVRHNQLIPQLRDVSRKHFDAERFAKGLYAFALGMGKKILIADTFASVANVGFANVNNLNTLTALIAIFSYTIQIYFDFSGYSDMVIGIGYMFNLDMPVNFNSPYKATNIMDFWKRWHMSLTSFLTEYVYYPLGGNRKGTVRTYINIFCVFLISGIWHGASWGFVAWGILHGLAQVFTRFFKRSILKMNKIVSWLLLFGFVNFSWIFFRADGLSGATAFIKSLLNFNIETLNAYMFPEMLQAFMLPEVNVLIEVAFRDSNVVRALIMVAVYVAVFVCTIVAKNTNEKLLVFKPNVRTVVFCSFVLAWCIVSFSGVTSFIYVNF